MMFGSLFGNDFWQIHSLPFFWRMFDGSLFLCIKKKTLGRVSFFQAIVLLDPASMMG